MALVFLFPGLSSCTTPDGDTGDLGGTWVIETIDLDEVHDASYPGNSAKVMVSFQGKLFSMAPADGRELVGSWERDGDRLVLDAHWGAGTATDWPAQLGFGNGDILTFIVSKPSSKRMEWTLQCSDGHTRTYHLRKI